VGLSDLLTTYPNDNFEGMMRYSAIDTRTDSPTAIPPAPSGTDANGQTAPAIPPHIKFVYLPRIRCHDCPGKLYTPGPGMTVENFEVHLKNRLHREKVDGRVARTF
jgi:SWI/SNF-related matrix-associated actin-dependent regulator of chromatin subfamily B protein 1